MKPALADSGASALNLLQDHARSGDRVDRASRVDPMVALRYQ
jgi:hypothetical protein